jgi:hypothetical protein
MRANPPRNPGPVIHPQSDATVKGVADRLQAQSAVDEEVPDPALGNAVAEAAAPHDFIAQHAVADIDPAGRRSHDADDYILDDGRFADARLRGNGASASPAAMQSAEM